MFVGGLRDRVIWVLADMSDEEESSTLTKWLAESVTASLHSGQVYVVRHSEEWKGVACVLRQKHLAHGWLPHR